LRTFASIRDDESSKWPQQSTDHHGSTRVDEQCCTHSRSGSCGECGERRSISDESDRKACHGGREDNIKADRGGVRERRTREPTCERCKVPRHEDGEARVPRTGKINAAESCHMRAGQGERLISE
jgi:hypothetical protein